MNEKDERKKMEKFLAQISTCCCCWLWTGVKWRIFFSRFVDSIFRCVSCIGLIYGWEDNRREDRTEDGEIRRVNGFQKAILIFFNNFVFHGKKRLVLIATQKKDFHELQTFFSSSFLTLGKFFVRLLVGRKGKQRSEFWLWKIWEDWWKKVFETFYFKRMLSLFSTFHISHRHQTSLPVFLNLTELFHTFFSFAFSRCSWWTSNMLKIYRQQQQKHGVNWQFKIHCWCS